MEAVFVLLIGVGLIGSVMGWLWFLAVAFRVNEGYGLGCMVPTDSCRANIPVRALAEGQATIPRPAGRLRPTLSRSRYRAGESLS